MKRILLLAAIGFFVLTSSCKTTSTKNDDPILSRSGRMACSVEISEKTVTTSDNETCSFKGSILDENKKPLSNVSVFMDSVEIGTKTNARGKYSFNEISPGNHVFRFIGLRAENCFLSVNFSAGDQVELNAILHIHHVIENEKPIIYLYPEDTIDVEVELVYDGKITTTYPKLTTEPWKVKAFPDGTLIDENNKEYYALYWEGEPTKPLGISDGFVISKEQIIPFLEEKLTLLGLNAKESNEFIIYWLPILERNEFNLIHFAGDDYLKQAVLNISPNPETVIRVSMVFQGLDEEIDFPIQDLSPLMKTRKGFTVVEWGGQQLPKTHGLGI